LTSKKSYLDQRTWPRALSMMSLEAKNGGAFMGAAFRKFSTLGTEDLRVLARRFLHFWNHPLPIPCQLPRGKGAPAESFSTRSTRRVPCPPGQEEPGWNGREDLSSLMNIILRTRPRALTKSGICGFNLAVPYGGRFPCGLPGFRRHWPCRHAKALDALAKAGPPGRTEGGGEPCDPQSLDSKSRLDCVGLPRSAPRRLGLDRDL
jgi:hypothetical protein